LNEARQKSYYGYEDGGSLLPPIGGWSFSRRRRSSKGGLVLEQQFLFPRKFDQSRWSLRFDVDLALRSVDVYIVGYGGHDGDLIAAQSRLEVPVEGWSEAYYGACSELWTYLEAQLERDR
jgi:hypothetical protein